MIICRNNSFKPRPYSYSHKMRISYFLSISVILVALILSSCSSDYQQGTIGEVVRDQGQHAQKEAMATTTTIPLSLPTTTTTSTSTTSTTTRPTTTTTTSSTTTTTSTTTTLSLQQQEILNEEKYAYLVDLTSLNLNNCNFTISGLQSQKQNASRTISQKKDAMSQEQQKLDQSRTLYDEYKAQNNETGLDAQSQKISDSLELIDKMQNDITNAQNKQDDVDATLKKVKERCISIAAMS